VAFAVFKQSSNLGNDNDNNNDDNEIERDIEFIQLSKKKIKSFSALHNTMNNAYIKY
jgi:hypothetical protein